jgi:sec-independent protein translocase protein TatC
MVDTALRLPVDQTRAPLMSHLKELRNRVVYSAIALGVGLLIGMFYGSPVIRLLEKPAGSMHLITTTLLEPMAVYFQCSILTAVVIAMPVLVYQLMAFIAPGLTKKEKRVIFTILPFIIFMFLLGVVFAYYVALPPAIHFLYHFNNAEATAMPQLSTYVSMVIRLLLAFGLIFETPLIIMALAKLGVVSPKWMAGKRKWWVLLSFIIAGFLTPTTDPVSQTVVAVVLILLMELGILLSRLIYKKKRTLEPDAE